MPRDQNDKVWFLFTSSIPGQTLFRSRNAQLRGMTVVASTINQSTCCSVAADLVLTIIRMETVFMDITSEKFDKVIRESFESLASGGPNEVSKRLCYWWVLN